MLFNYNYREYYIIFIEVIFSFSVFFVHHFPNSMLTDMCAEIDSYQSTLKLLFQEFETGSDTESQLAVVLTKIMQALQNNLDGKSKQYKDPALMCIFLANNIHYMVRSVRRYAMFCVSGLHYLVQTVYLANNFFLSHYKIRSQGYTW